MANMLSVLTEAFGQEDFPQKKLLILEGPAGSGKTTLCEKLRTRNPEAYFPIVKASLGKRHFTDENKVLFQSAMNDNAKLFQAIGYLQYHQAVAIDRCFLSQIVYHRIRQALDLNPLELDIGIPEFMERRLINAVEEALIRGFTKPIFMNLDYHFIGLIPSPEQLDVLRSSSTKSYPNDPKVEHHWYSEVFRQLQEAEPGRHLILSDHETYFEDLIKWQIPASRSFIEDGIYELQHDPIPFS